MVHLLSPLALAAVAFGPLPQDDTPAQGLATLEMKPVELRRSSGGTVTVERGNLTVPIVRSDPESKLITIDVWRFPAVGSSGPNTPPIFRLYGGPGWPGFEPNAVDYDGDLLPLLEVTDLVIVGQRGIGTSKPNTFCMPMKTPPDGEVLSREEKAELIIEACGNCRRAWEKQGYDLRGLNVIEAAADVDDVRRLLGYDKITLWGGSFGSHWGMTIMRYHPDIVARAVLTGMEGPDHTYDMPSGVLKALERMAAEAESSSILADHVPEDGLIEAFKQIIADIEEEPLEIEIPHPRTGKPELVRIDADDLRDMSLGYTGRTGSRGGARTWAADILALYNGEFERAAQAMLSNGPDTGLPTASFFMLDCGSGISPARLEQLRNDPAAAVVGDLGWYYETACSAWDSDLGDEFRASFFTEIPTVIVHGTWDTSTPFDNALELVPSFKQGHFVIVEGGSHGALGEAMRESEAFSEALLEFIASGDTAELPDDVQLSELDWAAPHASW